AHCNLDGKDRSFAVPPAVNAHGILDRDAAEQPTAPAAQPDLLVLLALVLAEVTPHHQLARCGGSPVLGHDDVLALGHGKRIALGIHEHRPHRVIAVEAAIFPTVDARPHMAAGSELEIRAHLALADVANAHAARDALADGRVRRVERDAIDAHRHREPIVLLGVHH